MVILFAPLFIFLALAISHFASHSSAHVFTPMTLPGQSLFGSAGAGLGIMLWSYIGYDSATTTGGEIDNPSYAYPKALMWNLPLIALSYTLPVLAALASGLHLNDISKWDNGDFANAASLVGGAWLKDALIIGALVAQAGLFSSFLLCMSRLPFMLAADRYLPKSMARISPKSSTPVRAIVVSVFIYAFFASLNFTTLIDSDVVLTLFALLLEFLSLLVLRYKYPNMKRPFKIKGGWWGAIGVCITPTLLTLWMLESTFTSEPLAFWLGIGLASFGATSYFLLKKFVKKDQPDAELDLSGIDFGDGLLANAPR
jgi:amino acid transporter